MIYEVYSVFDSKVGCYLSPFFMRSKGEAMRAMMNELENDKSNISKYPEDFVLFKIGTYDESVGKLESVTPESIGVAIEFKRES